MGKLLYFPILSYGHLNIGITLANHLLDLYGNEHEVYFVVDKVWEAKLKPQNPRFHYKIYTNPLETHASEVMKQESDAKDQQALDGSKNDETPVDPLETKILEAAKQDPTLLMITRIAALGRLPAKEQALQSWGIFVKSFEMFEQVEPDLVRIIDEVKPDLILTDQMCPMPFIVNSNIPWAVVLSASPLAFGLDEHPPCNSGLRMNEKEKWASFRKDIQPVFKSTWDVLNNWLVKHKCRPLRPGYFMYESPYFNIYCYPKELEYDVPLPGRWLRLESAIAPSTVLKTIELPSEFAKLPGRLIYFSMGSLFSSYLPMMQRLIDLLGQIPHKFIISKGSLGHELNLPANCWGENFLDQKAVLNTVDLIISHGGNNTTIESFHFGVPMIILPICGDQHDNAIRLEETKLGRQLKTYECTKEQLQEAIDSILNDSKLILTWKQAAERIQADNGTKMITDEMLRYLNKSKN